MNLVDWVPTREHPANFHHFQVRAFNRAERGRVRRAYFEDATENNNRALSMAKIFCYFS
jgi:hypothetical protein